MICHHSGAPSTTFCRSVDPVAIVGRSESTEADVSKPHFSANAAQPSAPQAPTPVDALDSMSEDDLATLLAEKLAGIGGLGNAPGSGRK